MQTNQTDADVISALGGPSKVAELLEMDKRGGAQRVQNWISRGIPAAIKVKYPEIFMPELVKRATPVAQAPRPAEHRSQSARRTDTASPYDHTDIDRRDEEGATHLRRKSNGLDCQPAEQGVCND